MDRAKVTSSMVSLPMQLMFYVVSIYGNAGVCVETLMKCLHL